MNLSWDEFTRVDMRVGVVVSAQEFPEARRPALTLEIDFGPLGIKRARRGAGWGGGRQAGL